MSSSAAPLSLNKSRWNIVYPIYMDSTKQIAEGRKIPLDKAVQKPTLSECVELCRYLKLPFEIEVDVIAYPSSLHVLSVRRSGEQMLFPRFLPSWTATRPSETG